MMQKFEMVPFQAVDLQNGFWADRQRLNSQVTLPSILTQFRNTGRFDAFRFDWAEGMPNKPHIFYDSDIAKWIESAAFILEKEDRPDLEAVADEVIDLIEEHQEENGYFNIWFTVIEPDQRFQKRTEHELYCAGHLFEAAVAYYRATGKDKFLRLMCKYADHIEQVFKLDHSAAFCTPGHEEIELGLVKLYEATGDKRYLELSKWFIDERGKNDKDFYAFANARYAQDHLPVREQTTAEGHSVRALYLYCGMADIAYRYGDESLLNACKTLFDNIVEKRMYITGGVGSSRHGEAFTIDYDLPNVTAYTESCAALALALFARRMLLMDADSKYADIAERVLYNGFLSSTSLDGKCFFYENPLEIDLDRIGRDISVNSGEVLPITQRVEVFSCSCCPPNITRFIASIGDFLYTHNADTLYIHHYMSGESAFEVNSKTVQVRQQTSYPAEGAIAITVSNASGKTIAVRIPGWCAEYTARANGQPLSGPIEKGYLLIPCATDEMTIDLELTMTPMLYEANAKVHDDAGKVALLCGPIVYCIEGVDHEGELTDLLVDADLNADVRPNAEYGMPTITVNGWRRVRADRAALYQPLASTVEPQRLNFIPYYAFANRGESDMQVWVRLK